MLSRVVGASTLASTRSLSGLASMFASDLPKQSSLDEAFLGISAAKGVAAAPSAVTISKLQNGVTVASQDLHGAVASLGLHVRAGSRYETVPGTAHFLEHAAFLSTKQRSTVKLNRDVEDLGARVGATASRETFVYAAEVLRGGVGELVEVLGEAAGSAKLVPWEVKEAKPQFLANLEAAAAADPLAALVEGVHAAAYGAGSALGHSFLATPDSVAATDFTTLRAFMDAQFMGGNVVLAGVNVEHTELLDAAHRFLSALPAGASPAPAPAVYTGGEFTVRAPAGSDTHVAIALPAPGVGHKSEHALGVLQALLGGAASRTAILTGRSRLALAAAGGGSPHRLASFTLPLWGEAGLLGLAGSGPEASAGALLADMAKHLKGAANTPPSAEELTLAKATYKLALLEALDARAGARKDLGSFVLRTGRAGPSISDRLRAIDAVTAADVAGVARTALSSPPAVAAFGGLATMPRYEAVAYMLK